MSDSFITVVAVALSAVVMFVLPVITMADRVDKISQIDTETVTSEFINEIKSTGKLTEERYTRFMADLSADRKYL